MTDNDFTPVQAAFEAFFHDHWRAKYDAYRRGADDDSRLFAAYLIDRDDAAIPQSVRDAVQVYLSEVEANDWGSVRLYRVPIAAQSVYAVMTTTDGDDGWLEVYNEPGDLLAAGRTYLELIDWGDRELIRAQTTTGEFPPSLDDRDARTLWGK